MTTPRDLNGGTHVWPLRGAWRAWLWISGAVCVGFVIVGLGTGVVAVLAAFATVAGLILLLPAGLLLGVGGLIGWQLWHTATMVTVGDDGVLVLRRPLSELRTDVADVQRVRRSGFVSTYTPTVVETRQGWAYLVRARAEKEAVIEAIRRHNPGLHAEI